MALSRLRLWGPDDPFRGDKIERLGADGQLSGMHSRVKSIYSSHGEVYEICDESNRVLYITKSGPTTWREVEID